MYRTLTITVFAVAIMLRLLLCWVNSPSNAFDNHFEPILLILKTGQIPAKDACFQCYNPPVYYYSSALVAQALDRMGMTVAAVIKSLQFLNCLYGIMTLPLVYLILRRFRLSELSRFIAFSIVCFLPRHIYMSAMHSNDCLTYLAVAICTYLLVVTIDRKLSWPFATLLGIALSLAIFVKYTAFIVLPMAAVPLAILAVIKSDIPRSRAMYSLALSLLPPLFLLGSYMAINLRDNGRALPWNDTLIDTNVVHPRDPGGVNFASFTPWQYIKEPIVIPGQMQSFWTLIHSGTWFDTEPHFTQMTDRNYDWWSQYFSWLNGRSVFPQLPIPISDYTRIMSTGLLSCGLVVLGMVLTGFIRCGRLIISHNNSETSFESVKLLAFPVLIAFNAAGIIMVTLKAPVYSTMKASYFLNSMPAFAVFLALGMQCIEKKRWLRNLLVCVAVVLMLLTALHIFNIAWSLDFVQGRN